MLGGRLRGGVRGVLAFVIAEEEFVNIAKAGEGRCVPSVRFSKVSGGKEGGVFITGEGALREGRLLRVRAKA